ncbi:hypothetical protein [Streptomyces buecherae]|uniref:hypothetical protein n=1 Tax=Streptomyces buecherae TaxID=2763006 RepID=UPI001C26B5CE|nr:hypothetical protein [Streptomyces buecherae]
MSDWSNLASQAASSLLGTLVGGAITVLVVRWQTIKTLTSQAELAAAQQVANARLVRAEKERERSAEAARQLLERLADLYAWLPSLPDVGLENPRLSQHAQGQCASAMQSIRRGMHTELLSIESGEVRERYRTLVKLVYEAGWRGVGREYRERVIRDARNYLRYVQLCLESVIDGSPIPEAVLPPVLDRVGIEVWTPPDIPWHWGDPADGS